MDFTGRTNERLPIHWRCSNWLEKWFYIL